MFVIDVPFFDLDKIYGSWQVPRWIKFRDGKYAIPLRDTVVKVEQIKDRILISCNEDSFYNTWYNYFDFETDYSDETYSILRNNRKLKIPVHRGSGIHIIKQDPYEAYIYGKLIERYGLIRASAELNTVAKSCGFYRETSMRDIGRVKWNVFPNNDEMFSSAQNLKAQDLREYIQGLSSEIKSGYDFMTDTNKYFRLFGLHDVSQFPINEIKTTLSKNFACDPEDFEEQHLSDCKNKGLVYLCILYHITNPPVEVTHVGISG